MGARDPAEQNGDRSQRDPVPRDIILPLVPGTGAHLLRDTLKSNPTTLVITVLHRQRTEF